MAALKWSNKTQQSFNTLKAAFSAVLFLLISTQAKPFIAGTDVSFVAVSMVLQQYDNDGQLHLCIFFSKALSLTE